MSQSRDQIVTHIAAALVAGLIGFAVGHSVGEPDGSNVEATVDEYADDITDTTNENSEDTTDQGTEDYPEDTGLSDGSEVGDGTYLVGTDIPAGTYRNGGASNDAFCVAYASREPNDLGSHIRGSTQKGPSIITVNEGEYFNVQFCQPWSKE